MFWVFVRQTSATYIYALETAFVPLDMGCCFKWAPQLYLDNAAHSSPSQVSLSAGASVFLGVYLRKPTSEEGSRVYLTKGCLNGERAKTEETVPVRQQRAARWSTNVYLRQVFDLLVSFVRHGLFFGGSYSKRGVGRMFYRFQASATIRRATCEFSSRPSAGNANQCCEGCWYPQIRP